MSFQTQIQPLRHRAQGHSRDIRHSIRDGASVSFTVSAGNSDEDGGVRSALRNVERQLQGRPGLSQEEQVSILSECLDTATEVRGKFSSEAVSQTFEDYKAKLQDELDHIEERKAGFVSSAQGPLDDLEATLAEARELASTRDFEAYQEEKRQAREASRINPYN